MRCLEMGCGLFLIDAEFGVTDSRRGGVDGGGVLGKPHGLRLDHGLDAAQCRPVLGDLVGGRFGIDAHLEGIREPLPNPVGEPGGVLRVLDPDA